MNWPDLLIVFVMVGLIALIIILHVVRYDKDDHRVPLALPRGVLLAQHSC